VRNWRRALSAFARRGSAIRLLALAIAIAVASACESIDESPTSPTPPPPAGRDVPGSTATVPPADDLSGAFVFGVPPFNVQIQTIPWLSQLLDCPSWQTTKTSGPTTAAMAFAYVKSVNLSPELVRRFVDDAGNQWPCGTAVTIDQIAGALSRQGVAIVRRQFDAAALAAVLRLGHPVLAPVYTQEPDSGRIDLAARIGHFMLITGVTPDSITAHDPGRANAGDGRNHPFPVDNFAAAWRDNGKFVGLEVHIPVGIGGSSPAPPTTPIPMPSPPPLPSPFPPPVSPPAIGAIDPPTPPVVAGEQPIVVIGQFFRPNLTVDLFDQNGDRIAVVGPGRIQNLTATRFTMNVDLGLQPSTFSIQVVNADGTRSPRFRFSTVRLGPVVTSIVPPTPPVIGGNQVIGVVGRDFQPGLTAHVLNVFGARIATLTGTQIQNVTPTSFSMVVNLGDDPGRFLLEVVNPDGRRSPLFGFETR
jgi:hypothetical protein